MRQNDTSNSIMSTSISVHGGRQSSLKYMTLLLTVGVPEGEQGPLDIQVKNGQVLDWKLLSNEILMQKSADVVFQTSSLPDTPLHSRTELAPSKLHVPLEPPSPTVKKELGEAPFEVYEDISNMKNHPFPLVPDPESFLNLSGKEPKTAENMSANIMDASSIAETMDTVKLPDDLSPGMFRIDKQTGVSVHHVVDSPKDKLVEQDSYGQKLLSAHMSDQQDLGGEDLLSDGSEICDVADLPGANDADQGFLLNREFLENIKPDVLMQKGYSSCEQFAYPEPRKRGRPRKMNKTIKENTADVLIVKDKSATEPVVKKSGRPPKTQNTAKSGDDAAKAASKKRGRPRKVCPPETSDTDGLEKACEVLDGGNTLRCKICGITTTKDKKFNSKATCVMKRHIGAIHKASVSSEEPQEKEVEKISHSQQPRCFVCDVNYDSDESLIIHTDQHLVQRYYIEPKMLRDLSVTYMKRSPDNASAFQCLKCGLQEECFAKLKRHILGSHLKIMSNHERQKLMKEAMTEKYRDFISGSSCTICGFKQDHGPALRMHVDTEHLKKLLVPSGVGSIGGGTSTEEPVTLERQGEAISAHTLATLRHCDQVIKNYHRDVYIMNDRLICDICGYAGRFKCNLANHMAAQHGVGASTYQCPDCPKVARSLKQLSSHKYNVHVQPFLECSFPGCKEIVRKHAMKKHIKRAHQHDREKPKCIRCDKSFTNTYSLQQHINTVHENKREYACDWPGCGKKFAKPWNRTIHYRIHTNEKPLQCELCGFQGRQKASMDSHYKTHHMKKVKKPKKQEENEAEMVEKPQPQMIFRVIL